MLRAAKRLCLCLGLLLSAGAAHAQILPQGLTCGLSYVDSSHSVFGCTGGGGVSSLYCYSFAYNNMCNFVPSARISGGGGDVAPQAGPGFEGVSDGDI